MYSNVKSPNTADFRSAAFLQPGGMGDRADRAKQTSYRVKDQPPGQAAGVTATVRVDGDHILSLKEAAVFTGLPQTNG